MNQKGQTGAAGADDEYPPETVCQMAEHRDRRVGTAVALEPRRVDSFHAGRSAMVAFAKPVAQEFNDPIGRFNRSCRVREPHNAVAAVDTARLDTRRATTEQ